MQLMECWENHWYLEDHGIRVRLILQQPRLLLAKLPAFPWCLILMIILLSIPKIILSLFLNFRQHKRKVLIMSGFLTILIITLEMRLFIGDFIPASSNTDKPSLLVPQN